MGTKILSNSFSGGEVSPTLMGRTDDSGYKTGAEILQNFIVNPTGSIRSRAGFEFVFEVPNNDSHVRLVPFRFSSDQNFSLDVWRRLYVCAITRKSCDEKRTALQDEHTAKR